MRMDPQGESQQTGPHVSLVHQRRSTSCSTHTYYPRRRLLLELPGVTPVIFFSNERQKERERIVEHSDGR